MFKIETEQEIKERIFKNIKSDLDKSEGSILNDIVGALALEIINNQIYFKNGFNASFIETATGELLDFRCKEHGVYRKQGKKALGEVRFVGEGTTVISKGTIIINNNTNLNYITTNDCNLNNTCIVEAENIGSTYNTVNADLKLIKDNTEVKSIEVVDCISGGENIETDDDLRERLYFVVSHPEGVGTVKDYERWALEVDGVKIAKAIPCYYGNGTVKVIIGGEYGEILDYDLVKRVQDYICPLEGEGYGTGKAPIGARAIITTFEKVPLYIFISNLKIIDGYIIDDIKENLEKDIKDYLLKVDKYVRYNELISIVIDSYGVLDFDSISLNEGKDNIFIDFDKKAVLDNLIIEDIVTS